MNTPRRGMNIESVAPASETAHPVEALATNTADQSLIPEPTWWKERTDFFCKLSFDLFLDAVAHTTQCPASPSTCK